MRLPISTYVSLRHDVRPICCSWDDVLAEVSANFFLHFNRYQSAGEDQTESSHPGLYGKVANLPSSNSTLTYSLKLHTLSNKNMFMHLLSAPRYTMKLLILKVAEVSLLCVIILCVFFAGLPLWPLLGIPWQLKPLTTTTWWRIWRRPRGRYGRGCAAWLHHKRFSHPVSSTSPLIDLLLHSVCHEYHFVKNELPGIWNQMSVLFLGK